MIEIAMHSVRTQNIVPRTGPVSAGEVMEKLSQILDKESFFGTINMKFEAGKLVYINVNQGFTVGDLVKTLNI
jgi:hypothetical protein